jgi:hypothetical protein
MVKETDPSEPEDDVVIPASSEPPGSGNGPIDPDSLPF